MKLPKLGAVIGLTAIVAGFTLLTLALSTINRAPAPTQTVEKNINDATVMITRLDGKSGGSGVVVSVGNNETKVLTNSHVCHVVEHGGLVTTTYGETHAVKTYKKDDHHDLCLIKIAAKLKSSATLANEAPKLYEEATISGHPNLFPNVVSKGHFSGTKIISVFTGIDKCSEDEMKNEPGICFFFGGMPSIKTYESVLVTALIMAGSSGSAVYNANKEVAGLVFAGSGDLSYAFIVPFAYLKSFVYEDITGAFQDYSLPNYKMILTSNPLASDKRILKAELVRKCIQSVNTGKIKELCTTILNDVVW